ncbi:MAG TPA: pyridoxine 5'-phosphate synthase [bacterium]|jgi:pyridoxine 5-phosphate synthase|nr:pyridoxine 5'-phosphate synthase [bacterium]
MANLCVNIDHIATLRQARGEEDPDPLEAARLVEKAGAQGITVHLREDRRHIQDRDVVDLRKTVKTKLNLEMAATAEMTRFALRVKPDQVTFVPEKRQELTTEGGLALSSSMNRFEKAVDQLQSKGIPVSLFIDPRPSDIQLSSQLGVTFIELHTGAYSRACRLKGDVKKEFLALAAGTRLARSLGLQVHAGHGLTYQNVTPIAALDEIEDLNIGHNIVARASMVGLAKATGEMLALLQKASRGQGRH